MDRYLYRGQIKNEDGLWHTGGLYCEGGLDWESSNWYIINSSLREHEVKYKTIGQCTGLKDKNGNLIFEGDIIQREDLKYCIVYYNKSGFFAFNDLLHDNAIHYEIIGNKHDSFELLKVK